ncbi:MAG: hypothetical protein KGI33_01640 [Thaumarchaeota archaeon]|nr:hypothetical protein [Nitrososphaerota archaeon]
MQNGKLSVDEMLKALECLGVRRKSLERLHPSPETISRIYLSLKGEKTETGNPHLEYFMKSTGLRHS